MSTKKIICGIAFIGFLICTFLFAGGVEQFIDLASISVVVILGALFAIAVDGDDSFVQKFGDGCVRAGWIGTIIGLIVIFGSERFTSFDTAEIGPAAAVCLLTILYGYTFKMLSMILGPEVET